MPILITPQFSKQFIFNSPQYLLFVTLPFANLRIFTPTRTSSLHDWAHSDWCILVNTHTWVYQSEWSRKVIYYSLQWNGWALIPSFEKGGYELGQMPSTPTPCSSGLGEVVMTLGECPPPPKKNVSCFISLLIFSSIHMLSIDIMKLPVTC